PEKRSRASSAGSCPTASSRSATSGSITTTTTGSSTRSGSTTPTERRAEDIDETTRAGGARVPGVSRGFLQDAGTRRRRLRRRRVALPVRRSDRNGKGVERRPRPHLHPRDLGHAPAHRGRRPLPRARHVHVEVGGRRRGLLPREGPEQRRLRPRPPARPSPARQRELQRGPRLLEGRQLPRLPLRPEGERLRPGGRPLLRERRERAARVEVSDDDEEYAADADEEDA